MTQLAKLFLNAKIFTSRKGDDGLYQALLVNDGKVVYVGDEDGAKSAAEQVSTMRQGYRLWELISYRTI
jgi:predicted amidohydrolase YtcJ